MCTVMCCAVVQCWSCFSGKCRVVAVMLVVHVLYCVFLSYVVLLCALFSCHVLCCVILSCLVLSCVTRSCAECDRVTVHVRNTIPYRNALFIIPQREEPGQEALRQEGGGAGD